MYKQIKDADGNTNTTVVVKNDGSCIPLTDPDNTDYQAYLKHIAEGGEVLPADEQGASE